MFGIEATVNVYDKIVDLGENFLAKSCNIVKKMRYLHNFLFLIFL